MPHTIVAFYRDDDQARRAHEELIDAGFDRDRVRRHRGSEEPGMWESIKEAFGFADEEDRRMYEEAARRGSTVVIVDVEDDATSENQAVQVLQRHGPQDIEGEAMGRQRPAAAAGTAGTGREPTERAGRTGREEEHIPIVEERMRVGKRPVVKGGVRVHTHVTERPVEEHVRLREEHARVERRPADRAVRDADRAFQERTAEVTERSEEAVVGKEARVVEEVVLDKDVRERPETVRDTVRGTEVEVERTGGRTSEFADTFSDELARDHRGRDWRSVEPDARRTFEQRYPGDRWDDHRDEIRRGYERRRRG